MKIGKLMLGLAALSTTGCVFDSGNSGAKHIAPFAASASGSKIFAMGQKYSSDGGIAALDRIGTDSVASLDLWNWTSSDVGLGSDSTGLYVIERGNSVVSRYGVSGGSFQVNVGAGANPYAVAVSGGKVWVACYGSGYIKAIDPSAGKLVDSIDLSKYSDTSDKQVVPNTLGIFAYGSQLAVVVGRLNGWKPGDSSLVLVVDPSSRQVSKRIALPWKNAYGVSWSGSQALVSCTGQWGVLDGGVALVDLSAGTARKLVSEQDLGGDAARAAFGPTGKFFVGSSDTTTYSVSVYAADLSTGAVGTKVSGSVNAGDMLWDGSGLWIGDMSASSPRVVRVDANGKTLWSHATTLPAASLARVP